MVDKVLLELSDSPGSRAGASGTGQLASQRRAVV